MYKKIWTLVSVFYDTPNLQYINVQEEEKRGQQNYEHLDEDLHVLISVEDTEDRAKLRLAKGIEKVKDLLQPVVSLSRVQKRQEKNCYVCFPCSSLWKAQLLNIAMSWYIQGCVS